VSAPSIGGTAVIASLAGRGTYTFHPQESRLAAAGTEYRTGIQSAEWVFSICSETEWDWLLAMWATTPATFELWDDSDASQSFTSGVMQRPMYEEFTNGAWYGVRVIFSHLMPLL
jgi:hypothetical protein